MTGRRKSTGIHLIINSMKVRINKWTKKYGEFVGVDNLYYALISADTAAAYTAGTPEYLAPVAEIAGEPEVANKTTYYENKPANNYVTEGKTELNVTVSNVPAQLAAILPGQTL